MKPVRAGCLCVLFVLMTSPLVVSGQQSGQKLPLAITDRAAVEEWSKTLWSGPLDPEMPSDTQFILSLSDTELLGRFRFKQRCALCHAAQTNLSTAIWGPLLTQKNVVGREDIVRRQIMEGSSRMPGFKYTLDPGTVDVIMAYLKRVETLP